MKWMIMKCYNSSSQQTCFSIMIVFLHCFDNVLTLFLSLIFLQNDNLPLTVGNELWLLGYWSVLVDNINRKYDNNHNMSIITTTIIINGYDRLELTVGNEFYQATLVLVDSSDCIITNNNRKTMITISITNYDCLVLMAGNDMLPSWPGFFHRNIYNNSDAM